MYGLPSNFDGSFLTGQTLEQVSFNQNQVCLHFTDHISITIESAFSHQHSPLEPLTKIEIPVAESRLMKLLGISVSNVQGDKDGSLTLVFENNHILKCFDTSTQYESYQITHGDAVIVV